MAGQRPFNPAVSAASDTIEKHDSRSQVLGAVSRHAVFRSLWLAALASSVGQWMQQVALGWLALVMSGSPGFVGIVAFAGGVPFLIVAPLGGSLIDRLDRRRLMLVCQTLAAALAVILALDVISGTVQTWHLPIAAFLNGSFQALLAPTQQSLVPVLVPRQDLTNAIGLMSAGQNATRVLGPSVAGVVIGTIGIGPTFLMQAAAIVVAIVLVLRIVLPPRGSRPPGRDIFAGIRLIASRPDLRGLFLLASVPCFFVFPYIGFLNVFARDILQIGAQGLGMLMAVSGSGAVAGSILVAAAGRSEGAGKHLVALTVLYGLPVVGIALSRTLWITLPLLFAAGVLGAASMSGNNALLQHLVSDDIRGRVVGAYMLTWGLMPLGALPMGMVADRAGTSVAVALGAVISSVLAAFVGLTSPALRNA